MVKVTRVWLLRRIGRANPGRSSAFIPRICPVVLVRENEEHEGRNELITPASVIERPLAAQVGGTWARARWQKLRLSCRH